MCGRLLLALVLPALAACVSLPAGPSLLVLPGTGKSFEQFRSDDQVCRQFANEQIGGVTPTQASVASGLGSAVIGTALGAAAGAAFGGGEGAAIGAGSGLLAGSLVGTGTASGSASLAQQRYDNGYLQCMYGKGHRVPVSGSFTEGYSRQGNTSSTPIPPPPPSAPPPPPPPSLR